MKQKTRNFFICFFLYQLITLFVAWFKQTYNSPPPNILWLFGIALILPTAYYFLILIKEIFNGGKLEAHEYDDAKNYFQEISESYQEIRFRPCCSDSLINAILDGKRQICQNSSFA